MGGVQTQMLTGIWWGLKIYFTLCVYAQNGQNFVGSSNVHARLEKRFLPLTFPTPAPQIWLLAPDPPSG